MGCGELAVHKAGEGGGEGNHHRQRDHQPPDAPPRPGGPPAPHALHRLHTFASRADAETEGSARGGELAAGLPSAWGGSPHSARGDSSHSAGAAARTRRGRQEEPRTPCKVKSRECQRGFAREVKLLAQGNALLPSGRELNSRKQHKVSCVSKLTVQALKKAPKGAVKLGGNAPQVCLGK